MLYLFPVCQKLGFFYKTSYSMQGRFTLLKGYEYTVKELSDQNSIEKRLKKIGTHR
jgi:hypothetical protein